MASILASRHEWVKQYIHSRNDPKNSKEILQVKQRVKYQTEDESNPETESKNEESPKEDDQFLKREKRTTFRENERDLGQKK